MEKHSGNHLVLDQMPDPAESRAEKLAQTSVVKKKSVPVQIPPPTCAEGEKTMCHRRVPRRLWTLHKKTLAKICGDNMRSKLPH